jgi:hypothetical protein
MTQLSELLNGNDVCQNSIENDAKNKASKIKALSKRSRDEDKQESSKRSCTYQESEFDTSVVLIATSTLSRNDIVQAAKALCKLIEVTM